jgi:hypothetical protein
MPQGAPPLQVTRHHSATNSQDGAVDHGWVEETCRRRNRGRPNGPEVHLRGQGPRAEADAAHGVHACESRDAGRAPPCCFLNFEAARPPDRSRAASGATSS